jgi:hypothetical protein
MTALPTRNRHWNPAGGQSCEVELDHEPATARDGQRPYRRNMCFRRLQQTTSVKHGAHAAHASDHVDGEGLVVGSIKILTVPKAAHA